VSTSEAGIKGATEIHEPSRGERTLGRRTAEVRATVPDFELGLEIDAGAVLALCEQQGRSFTSALVQACARALRDHPRANAAYRDGHYELYSRINIGVTLRSAEAHLTPTVFDADTKSLAELDAELAQLAERAEAGALTPPELGGATFTLTDYGSLSITRANAFIVPPQAAALSSGAPRAVPVVRDGRVVPGHSVELTLASDSRILFGTAAAHFLAAVGERLTAGSE
jgi:pyruvate dehydrogenase E2 component (dihydrolipoamide acetyltransferase)